MICPKAAPHAGLGQQLKLGIISLYTLEQQVYDVTRWVPHHPGGHLITIQAGRDCTQLFDSYHPASAR
jgi:predicted heme/steroid binding protein